MTTVQLKPELYRIIADKLAEVGTDCGRASDRESRKAQADLYNLMRTSKDVYDQAIPSLYRDFLMDQYAFFNLALGQGTAILPNESTKYARRIRLGYAEDPHTDVYGWIMRGGDWHSIFICCEPYLSQDSSEQATEFYMTMNTTKMLRQCALNAAGPMFPLLERLVSGSLRKMTELCGILDVDTSTASAKPESISVPCTILTFASVQHYCQVVRPGFLSLQSIIRLSKPPKVCTFHVTPEYRRTYPNARLPVILGSINRYIFDTPRILTRSASGKMGEGMTEILESVLPLGAITLCQHVVVSLSTKGEKPRVEHIYRHQDVINKTSIEVYGIAKFVLLSETEIVKQEAESSALDNAYIPNRNRAFASRPAQSLAPIQIMFDEIGEFAGLWKGRIKLMNREDTPVCTACDLDCQEQWRRSDRDGKYYAPG